MVEVLDMAVEDRDVGHGCLEEEACAAVLGECCQLVLCPDDQELAEDVFRRIGDRDTGFVDCLRRECVELAPRIIEFPHRIERVRGDPQPLARGDHLIAGEGEDGHVLGRDVVTPLRDLEERAIIRHRHIATIHPLGVQEETGAPR